MNTVQHAYRHWSDTGNKFSSRGGQPQEIYEAAYRQALEDVAVTICDRNAEIGLTEEARHFGRIYGKLLRSFADSPKAGPTR